MTEVDLQPSVSLRVPIAEEPPFGRPTN